MYAPSVDWNLSAEATAAILRAVDVFPGRGDGAEVFAVETVSRGAPVEGGVARGAVLKGTPAVVVALTYGANVGAWRFDVDGAPLDAITPSPSAPGASGAARDWRAWFSTFPNINRAELASAGFPSGWSSLGSVAGLRLALQLGSEAARVRVSEGARA